MEKIKKNISLIVGISIPILMIIFVAASIYLPGIFVKPQYNFLYVSGPDAYSYRNLIDGYSVQDSKLIKNNVLQVGTDNPIPSATYLYVYDVVKNKATEISLADAQKLTLDSSITSPDGFEVVYGTKGGDFLLFDGGRTDYNTRYLQGHNVSKKLNLKLNGDLYYRNFRFLGWIK